MGWRKCHEKGSKGVRQPEDPTHRCRALGVLEAPVSIRVFEIHPAARHGNHLLGEEEHYPLDGL